MPALEEGSGTVSGEQSTPEEEPKSLKDPISAASPSPRPTSHPLSSECKSAKCTEHHCGGHNSLISVTISWTSYEKDQSLGRKVGGREHCRAAGHCTASGNHTVLLKGGKSKWSRLSYPSGDTFQAV